MILDRVGACPLSTAPIVSTFWRGVEAGGCYVVLEAHRQLCGESCQSALPAPIAAEPATGTNVTALYGKVDVERKFPLLSP